MEQSRPMLPTSFEPELQVEIKNVRPIELLDLTESFLGLADEFREFTARHNPDVDAADVRLYVHEVRSGSVIATLAALSPQLLQGLSYANAVFDFATHLGTVTRFLTGNEDKPPVDMTVSTLENVSRIVEPVAKDGGAQFNVHTLNGNIILNVTHTEANAIQNKAKRLLTERTVSTSGIHEKVLMHWFQARADRHSRSGDRAVIEKISPRPVKVICATDALKSQMVLSETNPFQEAFIVDVVADTINGKVAVYKILALHDRFVP